MKIPGTIQKVLFIFKRELKMIFEMKIPVQRRKLFSTDRREFIFYKRSFLFLGFLSTKYLPLFSETVEKLSKLDDHLEM